MKLSIALILILCAANAHPIEEEDPFYPGTDFVRNRVIQWTETIPGWQEEASLEKNVVNLATKHFDGEIFPAWNPNLSAKKNLENIVASLDNKDFNEDATLNENIKEIVSTFEDNLPIPSIFPKNELTEMIADTVQYIISSRLFKDKASTAKLGQAIDDWIESLDDIEGRTPAEVISHTLGHFFKALDIPGLSPNKTIQDNFVAFAEFTEKNDLKSYRN